MLGSAILLHLSLSWSQGLLVCARKAADSPRRPQLLVFRGGVQAAPVVENATTPSPSKRVNASHPSGQTRRSTQQAEIRATFGVRDAVIAAVGLSAACAVQWCCNANFMAKMMAFVPAHVRKPVWVLLSGNLAAVLFLFLRITNPSRAIAINQVLSKLVLNREIQSTLPSLVFVFILGVLAAIKALPAFDLKLLWAMFTSLALVVGAATIKFGGRRPNLVELLDWACDAISSSLSSSTPQPVR